MRKTAPMRTPLINRRRITAGLLAGTLLLAACGGGDEGTDAADPGAALPQVDEPADSQVDDVPDTDGAGEVAEADGVEEIAVGDTPAESDVVAEDPAAPPVQVSGFVDLVGADVTAASDVESNLLPSVVVDDLGNERKVNFRNLVPQEKPILLWMWAPH